MADSSGNFQFPSASPIASSKADYDDILASGDPQGFMAALRAGVPYQPTVGQNGGVAPAPPALAAPSQMAQAAATPEHQAAQAAAPYLHQAIKAAAPILGQEKTSSLAAAFTAGMQGQAPATGEEVAPAGATGAPAVPGNISPKGGTTAQGNPVNSNNVQGGVPTGGSGDGTLQRPLDKQTQDPAQSAAPGGGSATAGSDISKPLDPLDPAYRPTKWQRFGRGVVGGLVGAGKGAQTGNPLAVIGGGLAGVAAPGSEGATPYGAPNRKFSVAAQQRALQIQNASTNAETALKNAQAEAAATVPITELMAISNPALKPYVGTTLSQRTFGSLGGAAIKAQGSEDVADTNAQGKKDASEIVAARAGLKQVTGPDGKTTWVDDPNSEAFKDREALQSVRESQSAVNDARAEVAKAGNDPTSPAYKLAVQKLNAAIAGHQASQTLANARLMQAFAQTEGTTIGGDALPGSTITTDGTTTGSMFQNQYNKHEAAAAQFKDVSGAIDNLEKAARQMDAKGQKLDNTFVAAALAQPSGTATQWVQGQVAKSNLTSEQRDYVVNLVSAHENLQALRKAGGLPGSTEAQIDRLVAMLPNASTPDLDYFLKQTGQIKATRDRLASGIPDVTGGTKIDGKSNTLAKPKAPAAPAPSGATVKLQAPDGSTREVPADRAQHYIGLGAKVVK